MGRPKKVMIEEDEIESPLEETQETETELQQANDMLSAMEALCAGSTKIRVFRKSEQGRKMAYLEDFDPTEDIIAQCKAKYGGGGYIALGIDSNQKICKRTNFYIDERFKASPIEVSPTHSALQNQNNHMDKLLEVMLANQAKSDERMMQMMAIMMQSMAAVAGNRKDQDPLEVMIKMKSLFPDNSVALLTMLKEGMSLGNQMNQVPEKEEPFWKELVAALAPSVVPALLGGKLQGALPNAQPQNQPKTKEEMFILDINRIGGWLMQQAQAAFDPKNVAEKLVAEVEALAQKYPDKVNIDACLDFLEQDGWFDKLCMMEPRAKPFALYLQQIRDEVLSLYSEDEESDESEENEPNPDNHSDQGGAD